MDKFVGESRGPSSFTLTLIRSTEAITHETVYLQDLILTHKTDNVCRCYEIRECARDLCGYPKSLVSKQVVSFSLKKSLE